MGQQKLYLISLAILGALIFISTVAKPLAKRRDAVRVVKIVLTQWRGKDQVKARDQWLNQKNYPPVYNLNDYKFLKKTYEKIDGVLHAEFDVLLTFENNEVLPSGREWRFKLKDTKFGWKITHFTLLDKDYLEHNPLADLGKPHPQPTVQPPPPPQQTPKPSDIPEQELVPYEQYKTIPAAL